MNRKHYIFPTLALSLLCNACTSPGMTWVNRWGDPAPTSSAMRTIYLSPQTQYVNVTGGEVIKFVEGNKSFAWNFDGPDQYHFDLALVAPSGTLDHRVMAYVDPDPHYAGK